MYVSYNTDTNLLLQAARFAIDNTLQSVFKVSCFTQLLLRSYLEAGQGPLLQLTMQLTLKVVFKEEEIIYV